MQHLDTDRLAALADEAPTEAESAHLASCLTCRREHDAFVTLVALAKREGAAGLAPNVAATDEPITTWDGLATALHAEGLIRSSAAGVETRDDATRVRQFAASTMWRRAAASVALLVGGGAVGRATAPQVASVAAPTSASASQVAAASNALPNATPKATNDSVPNAAPNARQAEVPNAPATIASRPTSVGLSDTLPVFGEPSARLASNAPTSFRSVNEAVQYLNRAQRDYQRAASYLAEHDSGVVSGSPQVLTARLAAFDEVMPKVAEALREAPQDPVLNQFYLNTVDVRASTMRQLGRALPVGSKLTGY